MLKALSLKGRLLWAFLTVSAFVVVVGAMGILAVFRVATIYDHVAEINLGNAITLNRMSSAAAEIRVATNRLGHAGRSDEERATLRKAIATAEAAYVKADAHYQTIEFVPGEAERYQQVVKAWEKLIASSNAIAKLSEAPGHANYQEIVIRLGDEYRTAAVHYGEAINELIAFQDAEAAKWGASAGSNRDLFSMALTIVAIVGVLLAILLGVVISMRLSRSLQTIAGDLDAAAEQTLSASGQVSSSSQSLAEGASEQAASLEETSATLEQISSMTKQNAEHTAQVERLAQEARDSARKGGDAMTRMEERITAIKDSSDKTAKIIKTIDEIAFQTNLLALNAAVEAARAGDAGRGFAVVAEEVRNLAQRSAAAAKDTSALIEESQGRAQQGVEVSAEVKVLLDEILRSVESVNDLVQEVTAASREQSKGVDQITIAVSQMDQVTQSNASAAEQNAAASEELSSQAALLSTTVGQLVSIVMGGNSAGTAATDTAPVATRHTALATRRIAPPKELRPAKAPNGKPAARPASSKPRQLRERILSDLQEDAGDAPEEFRDFGEADFK
ncbi:MAG: Tar ligand binding domain-containing protein [Candidatus Lambdaproteobacteria bacterium]|nr:Tar ligand binding domain-containing protein [Candidatus Lambdaproteobacteria bacterium]